MFKIGVLVIVIVTVLHMGNSMPSPDEERYFDKEYARELANWLTALVPPVNNPCRPNVIGDQYKGYQLVKRNSELINSLLSLPKTMNDVGK